MLSVGIIEDDREIREAIRDFLNAQEGFLCEITSESVEQFLSTVHDVNAPDIVLSDIGLPGMSGIDGIRLIRQRFPDIDIIMLTIHNDPDRIFQSLCAGASGYLLKNTPFRQIREGIEMLHGGGAPMSPEIAAKVITFFQPSRPVIQQEGNALLTPREREIVIALVDGLSYKMIAGRLAISIQTVQVHIKSIYRKLHAHSKAEVIAKSLRGEI
jgi:DNA-binding NarL/FixJ family response regulator